MKYSVLLITYGPVPRRSAPFRGQLRLSGGLALVCGSPRQNIPVSKYKKRNAYHRHYCQLIYNVEIYTYYALQTERTQCTQEDKVVSIVLHLIHNLCVCDSPEQLPWCCRRTVFTAISLLQKQNHDQQWRSWRTVALRVHNLTFMHGSLHQHTCVTMTQHLSVPHTTHSRVA